MDAASHRTLIGDVDAAQLIKAALAAEVHGVDGWELEPLTPFSSPGQAACVGGLAIPDGPSLAPLPPALGQPAPSATAVATPCPSNAAFLPAIAPSIPRSFRTPTPGLSHVDLTPAAEEVAPYAAQGMPSLATPSLPLACKPLAVLLPAMATPPQEVSGSTQALLPPAMLRAVSAQPCHYASSASTHALSSAPSGAPSHTPLHQGGSAPGLSPSGDQAGAHGRLGATSISTPNMPLSAAQPFAGSQATSSHKAHARDGKRKRRYNRRAVAKDAALGKKARSSHSQRARETKAWKGSIDVRRLPLAKGGYVGQQMATGTQIRTLEELLRDGYEYFEWDGQYVLALLEHLPCVVTRAFSLTTGLHIKSQTARVAS